MMPWEHAILGYIGFSLSVRLLYREPPTSVESLLVIFASLLPDLIDKPLAWQLDVFTSGHAFAHSVFVAVPVSVSVLLIAVRAGKKRQGFAFFLGYLLHLPADVLPQYLHDRSLPVHRVLWPLRQDGSGYDSGFRQELIENTSMYLNWIVRELASGTPDPYLLLLVAIGAAGLLLWVADGLPVARDIVAMLRQS